MNKQLLNEIKEGALEFWIEHNYAVATGKKDSEEWLDDEYLDEAQWRYDEDDEPQHDICCGCGKYDDTRPVCDCGGSHRSNCAECEEYNEALAELANNPLVVRSLLPHKVQKEIVDLEK